jgi:hypothetical protein
MNRITPWHEQKSPPQPLSNPSVTTATMDRRCLKYEYRAKDLLLDDHEADIATRDDRPILSDRDGVIARDAGFAPHRPAAGLRFYRLASLPSCH